ncbi:hypothetical protein BN871_CC_00050 [Paenibacillus sp. P22]|nr:hypothetical protein BN871_CC_00050 [Paenibacillus sp. P22]
MIRLKVLLVSGLSHRFAAAYAPKPKDILNVEELLLGSVLNGLEEARPDVDGLLVTDDALTGDSGTDRHHLERIAAWMSSNRPSGFRLVLLLRHERRLKGMEHLLRAYSGQIVTLSCPYPRIPAYMYRQAFEALSDIRNNKEAARSDREPAAQRRREAESEPDRKKSFLDRFRPKPREEAPLEATDPLARAFDGIGRGISRAVAVTGHRGSGVTSTAVNLVSEAEKRGLSAFLIDLDLEYRSSNMYFSRFHDETKRDEELNASLIRTLARPQDYMTTAFPVKDNLWLAALGYSFQDRKLIEQFCTSSKLVGLLSMLRNRFNLIVLDLPMDLLPAFRDAMIHVDAFGLCVPNNIHAVLSTARNAEVALSRDDALYMNAKSKVIVTKYNDRSRLQGEPFTPDKTAELLSSGLSESFGYEMKTAGCIPFSHEFDTQIETDITAVHSGKEYERAFGDLLLRLMEGAK